MPKILFIRLPFRPDEPCEWCLRSERERDVSAHRGALSDIDPATADAVVVLVPTAQLVLLHAQVPSKKRSQLLRALPYALEEHLAEDIDSMHVAAGPPSKDGHVAVAAVAHEHMRAWMAQLSEAGLQVDALVPDVLALAIANNEWSLLHEPDQVLVRTGRFSGWSAEPDNLRLLLEAELRRNETECVALYSTEDSLPGEIPEALTTRTAQTAVPAIQVLAQGYDPAKTIDLLQGPYQRRNPGSGRKRWALVAVLALALVGLELGALLWEDHQAREQALALKQQNERLLRQAFPDVSRIVDARAQMEQGLARLRRDRSAGAASSFLDLLEQTAPELSRPGIRVISVIYGNRELQLQLTAPDFGSLDGVQKSLAERGLQVDLGSARAQDDGVTGRLRIRSRTS